MTDATKNGALLQVCDLKTYFKIKTGAFRTRSLRAVDGVSFCVGRGEVLGLVGESGCGKTTVGRTLLGLYEPTGGEIIYDGRRIETKRDLARLRRHASMVFQDPYSSLDPRMTVADIIGEPIDIHRLAGTKKERQERILELMAQVGLNSEHASRYAHEFSGGQRQRIGIARALAVRPEFIVCDEPVSALDVSVQAQIVNMFERLRKSNGLTYLFIAHDLLVVRHISDRIAVMYLGRIVELARADDMYERPMHPYSRALISSVVLPDPALARKKRRALLGGDLPSPLDVPRGCPFFPRCPYAESECEELSMPSLREIEKGHFVACHRLEKIL